jgi:hypothetical protein
MVLLLARLPGVAGAGWCGCGTLVAGEPPVALQVSLRLPWPGWARGARDPVSPSPGSTVFDWRDAAVRNKVTINQMAILDCTSAAKNNALQITRYTDIIDNFHCRFLTLVMYQILHSYTHVLHYNIIHYTVTAAFCLVTAAGLYSIKWFCCRWPDVDLRW